MRPLDNCLVGERAGECGPHSRQRSPVADRVRALLITPDDDVLTIQRVRPGQTHTGCCPEAASRSARIWRPRWPGSCTRRSPRPPTIMACCTFSSVVPPRPPARRHRPVHPSRPPCQPGRPALNPAALRPRFLPSPTGQVMDERASRAFDADTECATTSVFGSPRGRNQDECKTAIARRLPDPAAHLGGRVTA